MPIKTRLKTLPSLRARRRCPRSRRNCSSRSRRARPRPRPSIITADVPDYIGIDDLRITFRAVSIDGDNGDLGQAAATGSRPGSQSPYSGLVEFDVDDTARLIFLGMFDGVLRHEIGHVLGLHGSVYSGLGLLDSTHALNYTGANALQQYRQLSGNANAVFIPLEPNGSRGSAGQHWSESVFGDELMTRRINTSQPTALSAMSIGALEDIRYSVDYSQADTCSLPSSTALITNSSISKLNGYKLIGYNVIG